MQSVNLLLIGAIGMASMVIGLFFLRFWKSTNDRFFLFFSASFLLEGCNRLYSGLVGEPSDQAHLYYVIRLISYLLILLAILDKNLGHKEDK